MREKGIKRVIVLSSSGVDEDDYMPWIYTSLVRSYVMKYILTWRVRKRFWKRRKISTGPLFVSPIFVRAQDALHPRRPRHDPEQLERLLMLEVRRRRAGGKEVDQTHACNCLQVVGSHTSGDMKS